MKNQETDNYFSKIERFESTPVLNNVNNVPAKFFKSFLLISSRLFFLSCWGRVGHHGYKTQMFIGSDCDFTDVMVYELGHSASGTSRADPTVTTTSVSYWRMCY